jgi:hypothetical protein
MIKEDPYTGERKCEKCGCWFKPDYNEFYGLELCEKCRIEVELEVDKYFFERSNR